MESKVVDATSSPLRAYLNRNFPAALWREKVDQGEDQEKKGWTDKDLMEHFFTLFGVNVFTEGSIFYQFKYEMCLTETWNEEVKEARGIIFERRSAAAAIAEEGWVIVGRPFEKFFNQQESECPVASAKVFDANCSTFGMAEKADGTCIQFWWSSPATLDAVYETALQMEAAAAAAKSEASVELNVADDEEEANEVEKQDVEEEESDGTTGFQGLGKASLIEKRARRFKKVLPRVLQATADSQQQGEGEAPKHARGLVRKPQHYHGWRISTLGMVTPAVMFERLFWGLFLGDRAQGHDYEALQELFKIFDQGWTYLFELCCEQNQVVNKYTQDKLYLIGARHRHSGELMTKDQLDTIAQQLGPSVSRPRYYDFSSIGVRSLKQANEWIENEAKRTDLYGETPEGFVVYWNGLPVAKMKNRFYSDKHLLITGNLLSNRNIAIERYFDGTIDDVLDVLPPPIHTFLDELKEKTKELIHEISRLVQQFTNDLPAECFDQSSASGRKAYADAIKTVDAKYKGLLFQIKDDVLQAPQGPGGQREVANLDRLVFGWLKGKLNYAKFHSLWKATKVKEILDDERVQAGGNYKS